MTDEQKPRKSEPIPDELGKAIHEGKETASYLWQVPDDTETRKKLRALLESIRELSARKGRTEMPKLCEELMSSLDAAPSPQEADLLQDGFDRMHRLWSAAKSGWSE